MGIWRESMLLTIECSEGKLKQQSSGKNEKASAKNYQFQCVTLYVRPKPLQPGSDYFHDCMYGIDDWIYFSCVLCILIMFDWFTLQWLMDNLGWIVFGLLLSLGLLFFFPLLLGFRLKNEMEHKQDAPTEE